MPLNRFDFGKSRRLQTAKQRDSVFREGRAAKQIKKRLRDICRKTSAPNVLLPRGDLAL